MEGERPRHPRLPGIVGSIRQIDGFPRPDWEVIQAWMDKHVPLDAVEEFSSDVVFEWLDSLRNHLAGSYVLRSGEGFWLLSTCEEGRAESLLRCAAKADDVIAEYLRAILPERNRRCRVILAFGRTEHYYTYVSHYFPPGTYGSSAGMFIQGGCPHIVLASGRAWGGELTIVHELTHAALDHLPVPAWVGEGLAQLFESLVVGCSTFVLDHDVAARHRRYWLKHGIQKFWSGAIFEAPDEGQDLGYTLAEILVRNLATDHGETFLAFVQNAERADAGNEAARRYLGMNLAACAQQFLGEGDWVPDVEALRALSADDAPRCRLRPCEAPVPTC